MDGALGTQAAGRWWEAAGGADGTGNWESRNASHRRHTGVGGGQETRLG
jgi:hypothetical protein